MDIQKAERKYAQRVGSFDFDDTPRCTPLIIERTEKGTANHKRKKEEKVQKLLKRHKTRKIEKRSADLRHALKKLIANDG